MQAAACHADHPDSLFPNTASTKDAVLSQHRWRCRQETPDLNQGYGCTRFCFTHGGDIWVGCV